eukprot:gene5680-10922_t
MSTVKYLYYTNKAVVDDIVLTLSTGINEASIASEPQNTPTLRSSYTHVRASERVVPGKQTELNFRGSDTEHYPDSELGKGSPKESNTEIFYHEEEALVSSELDVSPQFTQKKLHNSTS